MEFKDFEITNIKLNYLSFTKILLVRDNIMDKFTF